MPSRAELELRARAVNVDASSYANDSKLEQKVIYAEKNTVGDAVQASGTLTSDATAPSNGDTVTIGGYVYTFKTALTSSTAAFEVLIGGSAAVALDNLKAAINNTGGTPGTDYGSKTYAHPDVTATTNTNTTQVVQAKNAGTEGNAIATTETSSHLSWGASTLASGANGTYYKGETNRSEAQVSGGANV
jgi:hypothetical protein